MPRSRFNAKLRRGGSPNPEVMPTGSSAPFPLRSSASPSTILLVEDDPSVRVGLARVLATEGWHIVTAGDGEEALERLAVAQPDLLITDLSMGDVSGWDLLLHENLQHPALPIIIITAHPRSEFGGLDALATAFFQKPLDLDALITAIRQTLERRQPSSAPS